MRMDGRRVAALIGVLVGLAGALVAAVPASAHAVLTGSSPARNSIVQDEPAVVILTFNEPVHPVSGKVQVIGPDGQPASRGDAKAVNGEVSVPLRAGGPQGTYLVSFRVISADNHPITGGFTFSVGVESTAPSAPVEKTDPVVSVLVPAARYLGYAGLVLVIGPVLVLYALWPNRLSRTGPTRVAWVGLGLLGLSTLAALLLQAPYTTGTTLFGMTFGDLKDVLSGAFGTAHLVRLAVIGAAAFLLRPMLAGRGGTADKALLAILGVIGIATWPIAGHPAASPVPTVSVLADAAHLTGMAVWLGGLVMLFTFLLRQANEQELGAILPIWSRWAALAVTVLVLAGVLQGLVEVGTPGALFATSYGRLLLAKIGLLAVALGVAWFSRRLVQSRMGAGEPRRIRRTVGIEVGITALVLVFSSVLVQTTPGRAAEASGSETGIFSTTLANDLYSLQVQIDPATVGSNSLHLYAYTAEGQPKTVVEWSATAALPAAGVEPIDVPLLKVLDYHAIGEITLPTPGEWQFRFTLRTSDIDRATVTATVPVR